MDKLEKSDPSVGRKVKNVVVIRSSRNLIFIPSPNVSLTFLISSSVRWEADSFPNQRSGFRIENLVISV